MNKLSAITFGIFLSSGAVFAQDSAQILSIGNHDLSLVGNGKYSVAGQLEMVTEGGGIRVDENGIVWVFTGAGWIPAIIPDLYGPPDIDLPEYFQGLVFSSTFSPERSLTLPGVNFEKDSWDKFWEKGLGYGQTLDPCDPNSPYAPWVLCALQDYRVTD